MGEPVERDAVALCFGCEERIDAVELLCVDRVDVALSLIEPIAVDDILVVAPYNAQVRRLIETLPNNARVGTVDKFQGQEAPVVIYSMATSSVDDAPRGMDFLFSLNRMNVAASRAQGLVILVCSPELLKARCQTPGQMRLASALCRLVEVATYSSVTVSELATLGGEEQRRGGNPSLGLKN